MPLRWTRELLDLLADCDVVPYKASGPGGQHRNKSETAVRVTHRPTGIVKVGTESRSQSANKLRALARVWEELERRNRKPKPRTATKPTAASKRRRLDEKSRRGKVKEMRKRVDD
ncbi:MAG: peptide chain release factor-like protein [Candidatus Eisenbacteria bacterium]|uniref:Peptide chain release factor-like protein n=1 Tax=Eiseniibacteriota bacterium TaxID=2212470 RepID=A0A956SHB1_UNCEI|nr:peptide chain release factor-like protein [Candidatus Eisenbacteria bacterium]